MLFVFTGDGKGKTTAAIGQAVRLVGDGRRVLVVQFIKGPSWESGEDRACKRLFPELRVVKKGLGFVGILGDTLPRRDHKKAAAEALRYVEREARSGKWDAVILDEVNNAVALGLISEKAVGNFLRKASGKVEHVILTGRDAPKGFIKKADLVTEMRDIKHPFTRGGKAGIGVEF